MRNRNRSQLLLIILLLPLTVSAAPDWSLCSVPTITRQQTINYDLLTTEVEADRLISHDRQFFQFSGNVTLTRDKQTLSADSIEFFKQPRRVEAEGNIVFSDELFTLQAQSLELNDTQQSGLFNQAEFQLYENHMRGSASRIIQLDEDRRELHDVSYTTCDPGKNTWSFSADKLELNHESGQGTAHHAVFRVKDVPVFYIPWFMFPINDQRMSGLLLPTLSHTDTEGDQLLLPIYWNIAPNYDMTLIPAWYSERGLQLNTENRYLFNNHSGDLHLSWLDDDRYLQDRWFQRWSHKAKLAKNLDATLLLQKVSDTDFLDDFAHLEPISDSDFLESNLLFSSTLGGWKAGMLFEEYQVINLEKTIAARPYQRLPRLTLDRIITLEDSSFNIDWKNEWVRFEKQDSITGQRMHLAPLINYPLERNWGFISPSLQLDYTRYELDNNLNDINSIERSLPLFSLDTGLVFERLVSRQNNWIQTLEPRLYFLYVPYEDQSTIPVFDSALLKDSYSNLFVNNRFSGADRIGDSKQVSVGLTTRVLEQSSSHEIFSASIGQAFYADPRKVSIDSSIDDRDKSNLMALLKYKPHPQWQMQYAAVYDEINEQTTQTDFSLQHRADKQVLNLEYHFREDNLEQTTLSLVYPMTVNWTVFAKRQHSIRLDKPVQNLFGLAYESCCWGFKMLYEKASDNDFEDTERAIYFQLTFKGLSSAGKDIDSILENGILGYQPVF